MPAVERFCTESNARVNLSKSAFLRVNNCKLGPQVIKEVTKIKNIRFFLYKNMNDTTNANYNNTINTFNFLTHDAT
jgi:hypothetical protein